MCGACAAQRCLIVILRQQGSPYILTGDHAAAVNDMHLEDSIIPQPETSLPSMDSACRTTRWTCCDRRGKTHLKLSQDYDLLCHSMLQHSPSPCHCTFWRYHLSAVYQEDFSGCESHNALYAFGLRLTGLLQSDHASHLQIMLLHLAW